MNIEYARPRVVVSKCLGFDSCRWNGEIVHDEYVKALEPLVEFVPVCPEMEIGLGVPRKPVRMVEINGQLKLVQPETGRDCTRDMAHFCQEYLAGLMNVDGFILKGRSPSCGPNDVKIYFSTEKGAGSRRGGGAFGGRVQESFAHLALEHEGRLKNFTIRENFYAKLFTLARFRRVRTRGKMGDLVEYQADNKFLFMAYNQSQTKILGHIAANHRRLPKEEVFDQYAAVLPKVFARPLRFTAAVNALMHALGYFSKGLSRAEKAHFLEILGDYRQGKVPLSALLTLLTSWIARFEEPYLVKQTFFSPYPDQLMEITDSGKGRGR